MLKKAATFFLRTTTGKVILAVIAAATLTYGLRVYFVDMPALREKQQSAVGAATLESMGDALDDALSSRGAALQKELPALTAWYPAAAPCGQAVELTEPRDAVWELLGTPKGVDSHFQYRFEFEDGVYKIRARRDSDCDGFYAVWLLEAEASSVLGRKITAQNILE